MAVMTVCHAVYSSLTEGKLVFTSLMKYRVVISGLTRTDRQAGNACFDLFQAYSVKLKICTETCQTPTMRGVHVAKSIE